MQLVYAGVRWSGVQRNKIGYAKEDHAEEEDLRSRVVAGICVTLMSCMIYK